MTTRKASEEKAFNLNSYLISGVGTMLMLGITFIGNSTVKNTTDTATILTIIPEIRNGQARLENVLTNMVTRAELANEVKALQSQMDSKANDRFTRSDFVAWLAKFQNDNRTLKVPHPDR